MQEPAVAPMLNNVLSIFISDSAVLPCIIVPATNTQIHGRDTETHSCLRAIIAYRAHGMQGLV
jgi:hypothetical protein